MPIITGESPSTWRGSESRPQNDFSFLRGGGVSGGGGKGDLEKKLAENNKANTKAPLPDDEPNGGESGVTYSKTKYSAHADPNAVLDSDAQLGMTFWNKPVLDVDAVLKDIQLQNNIQATQVNTSALNGISATVLAFVDGATSNIQAQIDAKSTSIFSLTAGETISGATTPVAVFLQGSSNLGTPSLQESETTGSTDATFTSAGTYRFSQSFTATNFDTISSIYLKMSVNFGTATTYTLNLFNADANDKPTGSTLGTTTKITRIGTDYWHEFVFSSPITITQGNKYAMVVHTSDGQCTILYNNAGSYAGGKYASSTDSGATWTVNASYDLVFKVYGYKARTPGYVYKADIDNKYMSNFIGFAITTASAGNSITVQTSGVVSGFSGLTSSLRYSFDSSGLVSTVINGYEKIIIGEAISTTQILIDKRKSNVFDMDLEYEYKLQDLTMNDLTVTKGSNDSLAAYKEGYNYSGYAGANGSDSMILGLSAVAASDSRALRGIDITKYNEIKSSYLIKTATDATTGVPIYGFVGLSSFASALSTTSQVTNHVGFIFEAISDEYPLLFNVYCSCADGVTQTTSEVVGLGLLPENENDYKVIIYNSEARFYINGILVGRITTNLPTAITGSVFLSSYTGVVINKSNASRADNIQIIITRSAL